MQHTGRAQQHALGGRHAVLSTLDELLSCRDSKSISSVHLQQSSLESLGQLRVVVLQLATSSGRPQETRQCEHLLAEELLLLDCRLSLERLLKRLKLARVRLSQKLCLAGVLLRELLIELLVLCDLLLQLCELGLQLGLPQSLRLLVGVDLAGRSEVIERDTGVLCDDRVDLLGGILQANTSVSARDKAEVGHRDLRASC